MIHLGDITKLNGYEVTPVNVVIGGSPCQDLSIAGKMTGIKGQRSGLFHEQIRIIKEMRHADESRGRKGTDTRPQFMLWENVTGALVTNDGADFRTVLEEISETEIPLPRYRWSNAGVVDSTKCQIAWRVIDAQYFGVPQRRRRIALIADFAGKRAAEILFRQEELSWNFKTSQREKLQATTEFRKSTDISIFCVAGNTIGRNGKNGGGGKGFQENISYTLTSNDKHVISKNVNAIVGTLCANDYKGVSNQYVNDQKLQITNNAVRRLTPLECERLQGYPDNWTDIGNWKDSRGRNRNSTDNVRYKAIGNSIALPQWAWILQRISSYYNEPATMASLFDGIGGFPLIWESINGKETALWASEIDDFCIAVTNKHFNGA